MKPVFRRKEVCWVGCILLVGLITFMGCGNANTNETSSQSTSQSSNPNAPTARVAWTPANPTVNSTVILVGSYSSDPSGLTLSYQWTLTSKPTGSAAVINNATQSVVSFVPDLVGTYVIELTVNDGTYSGTTTVTITVSS